MKKYISKLYLFCIVIGIIVCVGGAFLSHTLKYGKIWESNLELIKPDSVVQQAENVRQYCFSSDDFYDGKDELYFYTAHMNVRIYADEISDNQLIYAFVAVPSVFGSTPGTFYHLTNVPNGSHKIYVVLESVYPELNKKQIDFFRCNGVATYRALISGSVVEAFISGILIILGFIIIIYCLYARKRIKVDISVIYFAIFTIILGAWTFNETGIAAFLFPNRTVCSLAGFLLLFLMQQPILLFTKTFLRVKDDKICDIFCVAITLTMMIMIALHMTGIMEMRRIATVIHVLLFLDLSYMIFCFIYHIVHYGFTRRANVNIIGAAILLLAAIIDMAAYYSTNRINDVIGRVGMLAYTILLATEVVSEFTYQMQESRKTIYYKELAMLDSLTGLQNRNAFEFWESNNKDFRDISLFTFDLNNLKECNDQKGHIVGDTYIKDSAKVIHDIFGRYGTCYRIGGDEFLVIMKKQKNNTRIEKFIQQLRKNEMEYNSSQNDYVMEIACGYASSTSYDQSLGDIRKRADDGMYANKSELKKQESQA